MFNQSLDEEKKEVTVLSGVKINSLLEMLKSKEFTVKCLGDYAKSDLVLKDLLFSTFYGKSRHEIVDDVIKEMTVVLPKEQEVLVLKNHNETTINPINTKSLFLRNDFILGIPYSVTLSLSKEEQSFEPVIVRHFDRSMEEKTDPADEPAWMCFDLKLLTSSPHLTFDLTEELVKMAEKDDLSVMYEFRANSGEMKINFKGDEDMIAKYIKKARSSIEKVGGEIYSDRVTSKQTSSQPEQV